MEISKKTSFGLINISEEAIINVVVDALFSCYGVIGIASKGAIHDIITTLLSKKEYSKGIIVSSNKNNIDLDIYLIIASNVKVTEVLSSVQKRIKYVIEQKLEINVGSINVYAQDLKRV